MNEQQEDRVSGLIYHLALASDWDAAHEAGDYRISSIGVTLEQEGFLHASRADQWPGVKERYYSDVTEALVLLVIDLAKLTSPMVVEQAANGETFPHIYGPLNLDAVVDTVPVSQ